MKIKPNFIGLLFAVFFLLAACPGHNNVINNDSPDGRLASAPVLSHNSGLHAAPFYLTMTVSEGSVIYFSTDGSIPSPASAGNGFVFRYTDPIFIESRHGQPNVLATPENSEQFYICPDDPIGVVPWIFIPSDNAVTKATVIRTIAVDTGGRKSRVLTRTFFIGNDLERWDDDIRVVSIVTDPRNLVGEQIGIMVRGQPGNTWFGHGAYGVWGDPRNREGMYNFRMRGRAYWERPAHLEIFEGGGRSGSVLSAGVGIRIRGGWTRAYPQKSLNVLFREEYEPGLNVLTNFPLIPGAVQADGRPVQRYKSFMLRNGGNDWSGTKFNDVFIQDLLRDRSFTTQRTIPAILYLNGEFWGPYNFSERYSDWHIEFRYDVHRNNVIMIEVQHNNPLINQGTQADLQSFQQMKDMRHLDMSKPVNFQAFLEVFCIDSFIDYWAAQIFILNTDWPHNNYHLWRARTPVPGNIYGDGRWRYQMHDTDHGLGRFTGGNITHDPFYRLLALCSKVTDTVAKSK